MRPFPLLFAALLTALLALSGCRERGRQTVTATPEQSAPTARPPVAPQASAPAAPAPAEKRTPAKKTSAAPLEEPPKQRATKKVSPPATKAEPLQRGPLTSEQARAPVNVTPSAPAPSVTVPAAPAPEVVETPRVLPPRTSMGQLRGLWVDAFGPGFKTPEQVNRLVADAQALHVNALFVQVGKRGDCYCGHASMPRTTDPEVLAGFDPLQDVIDKAHAAGIQVHAWIITTAIVNVADDPAPAQPDHVFNTHGLSASGDDNWLMLSARGEGRAGKDYLLDPGNPQAAEYIAEEYFSVVREYDVDGVQLDRVRYPDASAGGDWGYNPVSLRRYAAETGAALPPSPQDERWQAWRRTQVTNLVRRIALGVKAIKPEVWMDAATITYGPGPRTLPGFEQTRTYNEVFQDWPTWTRQGYLDLNVVMNYKRDDRGDQARWYDQWNSFAASMRGAGYAAAGSALYLNSQGATLRQVGQALSAGLDGWVGYSYRTPDPAVEAGTVSGSRALAALTQRLAGEAGPLARTQPWGHPDPQALRAVQGQVQSAQGELGGRTVELVVNGRPFARTQTDGGGYYGFMFTPPGAFEVRVAGAEPLEADPPRGEVTELPTLELP